MARIWLAVCMVAMAVVVGAQDASTVDPARLDRFVQDFAKKREAIGALTADFAQESTIDGELWSEDPAVGTVTYAKPKRILFLYEDTGRAFVIDKLQIYDYDPELEQVIIQQLDDKPEVEALFLGFSEDFTEVRAAYDLAFFETQDDSLGLQLTPKNAEVAEGGFERARLWLRPQDYLPTRVEVTITEDSINTYYLSEYETHDSLAPDRLHINVPAGTTVVQGNTAEILEAPRAMPMDSGGASTVGVAPLSPAQTAPAGQD